MLIALLISIVIQVKCCQASQRRLWVNSGNYSSNCLGGGSRPEAVIWKNKNRLTQP